ncbi:unnamed protein product [Choristocarpus tenellus]
MGNDRPTTSSGAANTFCPSQEELNAGEALLRKIEHATGGGCNRGRGGYGKDMGQPRGSKTKKAPCILRHHVEEFLDDVSDMEDKITKAREVRRGEQLMTRFYEAISLATGSIRCDPQGEDTDMGRESGAKTEIVQREQWMKMNRPISAGPAIACARVVRIPQCKKLSQQVAAECTSLLEEAEEAFRGQGFTDQADMAARFRAGIAGSQRLADAPSLTPAMTKALAKLYSYINSHSSTHNHKSKSAPKPMHTSAPSTAPGICTPQAANSTSAVYGASNNKTEVANVHKEEFPKWANSGFGFCAAKDAAREAEENFILAGDQEGAKRAQRVWLALRGDEEVSAVAPLLSKREGNTCESQRLCEEAKNCLQFVNPNAKAAALEDVEGAVCMVSNFRAGDNLLKEVDPALSAGEGARAVKLLHEAKKFYRSAQVSHERLVDQFTELLEMHGDDVGCVSKALELQDMINGLYSSQDGQRSAEVETQLDCLDADASLEQLAQVVDHSQFEDARKLLHRAEPIYSHAADTARLQKTEQIDSIAATTDAIILSRVLEAGNARAADAVTLLQQKEFDAAEMAATEAKESYAWWVEHSKKHNGLSSTSCYSKEELRQVLERAEENAIHVATSVARARGEAKMTEALMKREENEFEVACAFLTDAAELFEAAGCPEDAATARASADETQGDNLIMEAETLLADGAFEESLDRLTKAKAFFIAATNSIDSPSVDEAPTPSTLPATTSTTAFTHSQLRLEGGKDITSDSAMRQSTSTMSGDINGGGDKSRGQSEGINLTKEGLQVSLQQRLSLLEDLQAKIRGNQLMTLAKPALDAHDYDLALKFMQEARIEYSAMKGGLNTGIGAGKATSGKLMTDRKQQGNPMDVVMKQAIADGEILKGEATVAIQKEKNPVKARGLLLEAIACYRWAEESELKSGLASVTKDIEVFESRQQGDEECKAVPGLLNKQELGLALEALKAGLSSYRKGDAFKQITDTQAIAFCVEREVQLTPDIVQFVTANDPISALKALGSAQPMFEMAASTMSTVLNEAVLVIRNKLQHIHALHKICRVWGQMLAR